MCFLWMEIIKLIKYIQDHPKLNLSSMVAVPSKVRLCPSFFSCSNQSSKTRRASSLLWTGFVRSLPFCLAQLQLLSIISLIQNPAKIKKEEIIECDMIMFMDANKKLIIMAFILQVLFRDPPTFATCGWGLRCPLLDLKIHLFEWATLLQKRSHLVTSRTRSYT